MMKELLLTGLVLLAAIVYVRFKASRTQPPRPAAAPVAPTPPNRLPMLIAGVLVLVTLSVSGLIYYFNWQAAHQLYTVQVTNSHSGEVQTYQVYRHAIQGRRFHTLDGREIHLSDMERMEIRKGDE